MRQYNAARRAAFIAALAFCNAAVAQEASVPEGAPSAQETREQARAAYQAGVTAYRAGEYETAFAEFKKAHDLVPAIRVEYWMAMSASHCDDHLAARALLEGVLASPDADRLGPERLSSLRARLDELHGKSDAAAASKASPSQSAPADVEPAGEHPSRWPAYAMLGGAGVFGVLATTYAVLSLNANDAYERDHITSHHDAAQRDALLAGFGAVMAVGLGVTGFVLISGADSHPGSAGAHGHHVARLRLDVMPTVSEKPNGLAAKLTLSL